MPASPPASSSSLPLLPSSRLQGWGRGSSSSRAQSIICRMTSPMLPPRRHAMPHAWRSVPFGSACAVPTCLATNMAWPIALRMAACAQPPPVPLAASAAAAHALPAPPSLPQRLPCDLSLGRSAGPACSPGRQRRRGASPVARAVHIPFVYSLPLHSTLFKPDPLIYLFIANWVDPTGKG